MMPDVTGMEVFEEVAKSYPELSDQFVFITGGTLTSAANKFMNRIENPKFEKPLGRSEILKIVDDAICRLDSCDEASIAVSTTRAG
jgi:FixJ family two-component response regulator